MKTCQKCGLDLPLLSFARNRTNPDGLQSYCRDCFKAYSRARRERDRAVTVLPHDQGKTCPTCSTFKEWAGFAKNRSARDGRQTNCRSCSAQIRRDYFERNAEAVALRYKERLARTPDTGVKTCRKCGETKPLLSFYAHRTTKDRRANYCMECQRAATRAWQAANAEKVREHRAKRVAEGKRPRDHRQWWLKLYDLTQEQYAELLAAQGGVCAICTKPERYIDKRTGQPRRLAVDHDHETGKVRGLLCGSCNRGIGQFSDDHEVLSRAAEYLKQAALM